MENIIYEECMEGLNISRVIRNTNYTMPASHIHDNEYEIYYLLEGDRYYFIGTHTYRLSSGSLAFIRRDTIHKTASAGSSRHERILLEVSRSLLHAVLSATKEFTEDHFFRKEGIVLSLNEDEQRDILELFQMIRKEIVSRQTGYRLMIISSLIRLFLLAQRRQQISVPAVSRVTGSHKYKQVEEAACYITTHFAEPLSLQTVAAHFFMNKCYLSRIFKEVTGFTVNDYLHTYRIREACILLRKGDMNVSDISEAVGYESLTYFDRVFRKHIGLSPMQYKSEQEIKL